MGSGIFAKNTRLAVMCSMLILLMSSALTDIFIPSWEGDIFIQTASSMSLFNLLFRSIIIIIYSDDRCDFESKILTYFKIEEDKLWILFQYLIYQLIFFRVLCYFVLYIQANYEQINFKNFYRKFKPLKNLQFHRRITSCFKVIHNNGSILDDDDKKSNVQIYINQHLEEHLIGQNFYLKINENSSKNLAIAWNNLSYSKQTIFTKKTILQNLNGKIHFGTITALMGPSGAGKTTLFQCIYGIKRSGISKETQFYVNKFIKIKPIFIVQEHQQHLLMNLTVRESLKYSSLLKNNERRKLKDDQDNSIDKLIDIVMNGIEFDHNANVNRILSELMLTKCADNKVSQCSGGEQKRLSIGLELTPKIKPNLMCIDEPTTGLDSYAAEQVI